MSVCEQLDPALAPERIVHDLDPQARRLLEACRSLSQGCWDDMAEDIRRRQAGRPYLFRVECEPGQALSWIDRFRAYDREGQPCLTDGCGGTVRLLATFREGHHRGTGCRLSSSVASSMPKTSTTPSSASSIAAGALRNSDAMGPP